MKKATKNIFLLALGLFASTLSIAQAPHFCATDEMVAKSLKEHPELMKDFLAEQNRLEQLDKAEFAMGYPSQNNRAVYTIPIVFHILHENGTENISDAQVKDAVRILNEDFSKTNADISQVVSTFTGITGNPQLVFVLAKKDPNGVCTNGIIRHQTSMTNTGNNTAMSTHTWPRNKYLNIVVIKTMQNAGAAGYTYIPGTSPSAATDAIIIKQDYIGSIGTGTAGKSRALTHEVGHWFGLYHVWGANNDPGQACGDDGVSDTPVTEGWTTCNLAGNTCGGGIDNVQNFMEYSYCTKMFSAGQASRVQSVAASSTASRNSLWTASNLTATGVSGAAVLCKADFKTNASDNTVCQGSSLTFTDLSWNGTPTSWSWTFQGGTPATSSVQSPVVQYNTPGTYNVTLSVSNSSGTVSATKTGFVTVYATPGLSGTPFYSEGFEGGAIPNADWQVVNNNSGSNTWVQTNAAAATGTKCVRVVNASTYDGFIDELISPPINMTTLGTSPQLTFKVAHAQKTTTSEDQLSVLVSTNCGQSWLQRLNLKGVNLATAPVQTAAYTPTSTQWVTKTVNLSGYASSTNLLVMFRFTSNAGNSVYLDDINLKGTLSGNGIEEDLANNLNFNIYPNPMESNSIISFSLLDKQNVEIKILDVVGKEVSSVQSGNLNAGDYQYPINGQSTLSSGVYFVRLLVNNQVFTKKLIVK